MVSPHQHPHASVVPLASDADLEAGRVMVRELCGLVGVRNYHAQTVVTTVGALGAKVLAVGEGGLSVRVDPDQGKLFVAATLPAQPDFRPQLRELARAAHELEFGGDETTQWVIASFDYERLRQ